MKKRNGMSAHESTRAQTVVWLTPPEILQDLGPFDLDPCACTDRPWDTAARHYVAAQDGLAQPWDGFVWCNPPYGREAAAWLDRMVSHNNGIALIFARTETAMFFDHVWPHASALLFLRGRLHFHMPDGGRAAMSSGAPSVLVGYGREARNRLAASKLAGAFIE